MQCVCLCRTNRLLGRLVLKSILTERVSDMEVEHGGDKGSRTPDLLLARQALSQLSYAPGIQGRALKIE